MPFIFYINKAINTGLCTNYGQVKCSYLRGRYLGACCLEIVLVEELRDGVNAKFERWWEALKSNGFKLYKDKMYEVQLQWGCAKS